MLPRIRSSAAIPRASSESGSIQTSGRSTSGSSQRVEGEVVRPMISRRDPLANPEPLIRRVYAYAAYRLGDGPDAEDATSDTFERALRYRESYDRGKGEPAAW